MLVIDWIYGLQPSNDCTSPVVAAVTYVNQCSQSVSQYVRVWQDIKIPLYTSIQYRHADRVRILINYHERSGLILKSCRPNSSQLNYVIRQSERVNESSWKGTQPRVRARVDWRPTRLSERHSCSHSAPRQRTKVESDKKKPYCSPTLGRPAGRGASRI